MNERSQVFFFLFHPSGEPLQRSLFDYVCPKDGGPVEIVPVRDNSNDLPGGSTEPPRVQRLKRYIFDGLSGGAAAAKKPEPGDIYLSKAFLEELKRTGQYYREIAFAPEKGDELLVRISEYNPRILAWRKEGGLCKIIHSSPISTS
jgi:hypothetical protein